MVVGGERDGGVPDFSEKQSTEMREGRKRVDDVEAGEEYY